MLFSLSLSFGVTSPLKKKRNSLSSREGGSHDAAPASWPLDRDGLLPISFIHIYVSIYVYICIPMLLLHWREQLARVFVWCVQVGLLERTPLPSLQGSSAGKLDRQRRRERKRREKRERERENNTKKKNRPIFPSVFSFRSSRHLVTCSYISYVITLFPFTGMTMMMCGCSIFEKGIFSLHSFDKKAFPVVLFHQSRVHRREEQFVYLFIPFIFLPLKTTERAMASSILFYFIFFPSSRIYCLKFRTNGKTSAVFTRRRAWLEGRKEEEVVAGERERERERGPYETCAAVTIDQSPGWELKRGRRAAMLISSSTLPFSCPVRRGNALVPAGLATSERSVTKKGRRKSPMRTRERVQIGKMMMAKQQAIDSRNGTGRIHGLIQ